MSLPTDAPCLTVCQSREPKTKAHWSVADMKRSVRLLSRLGHTVEVYYWVDGWEHLYTVAGSETFPWEA